LCLLCYSSGLAALLSGFSALKIYLDTSILRRTANKLADQEIGGPGDRIKIIGMVHKCTRHYFLYSTSIPHFCSVVPMLRSNCPRAFK